MKTKLTIAMIIAVIYGLGVCSQTLQNTTWKSYLPDGTFWMYYHVGIDTISISFDNITYTNSSTYQEFGNNVIFVGLSGNDCPVSDTGRYTFLIHEDTLKFTLISDPCEPRATAMTTWHFVRYTFGIQNSAVLSEFKLFPNPANNRINLSVSVKNRSTMLSIFNLSGEKILERRLAATEIQLDISALPRGVYFVKLQNEKVVEVEKMEKE